MTATIAMTLLFDPWAGTADPRQLSAAARSLMHPPELAPMAWFSLPMPARLRLGGLALRVVADHPAADALRLAALVRQCLRASYTPSGELGMNADAAYPSRFYVDDPDERPTWRDAERALDAPEVVGHLLLLELVDKLRSLDGVEASLRKRRAAIDAQLERLATLRGPAEAKARR
jgi:hypothetical protein